LRVVDLIATINISMFIVKHNKNVLNSSVNAACFGLIDHLQTAKYVIYNISMCE